jgi:tetratricopeptide (TPR) repeat protein
MKPSIFLIPLVFCLLLPAARGQSVGKTISTQLQIHADGAKGAHLTEQVNDLVLLVLAKKLLEADRVATDLRKKFELSFDTKVQQYTFQSNEEYLEFKNTSPHAFEWIDWGYKECLQMQAFIAAERRELPAALSLLASIEAIAPVSAGTAAERGYVLNQLGRPEEALTAYKRALSLSTRYHSQSQYQAAALRGIGFSLIELQRLDEAETTFQDSLKIEPNNEGAVNELAYIRSLRDKR